MNTIKKDAQFIIDICLGLVEFIDQKNIVTIIEPLENWTGQTKIIRNIVFFDKNGDKMDYDSDITSEKCDTIVIYDTENRIIFKFNVVQMRMDNDIKYQLLKLATVTKYKVASVVPFTELGL